MAIDPTLKAWYTAFSNTQGLADNKMGEVLQALQEVHGNSTFTSMLYGMINMETRNSIYANWIDNVGVKDKIVLDAGACSGIWGYYALHHGAKHVIQIEYDIKLIHLLNVMRENSSFKDKITVIQGDLTKDFDYPEPDVIIAEHIGDWFFGENIHGIHQALYKQWPNAKFIPESAQPVIAWRSGKPDTGTLLLESYKNEVNGIRFGSWGGFSNNIDMPQEWITVMDALYPYSKISIITATNGDEWNSTDESALYVDNGKVFSLQEDIPRSLKRPHGMFEFSATCPDDLLNSPLLFATLDINIGTNNDLHSARKMNVTSNYTSIRLNPYAGKVKFVAHMDRNNVGSGKWVVEWS